MKLVEALKVVNAARGDDRPGETFWLVCGFTPLHLKTFLAAHLQTRTPARRVDLEIGLFGDLPGNVARAAREPGAGAAVVIEWADLDARLGLRAAGGWSPAALPDVVETARGALRRLVAAVAELAD